MDTFLIENEHLINNLYYGFAEKTIQKNSSIYLNVLGFLLIISIPFMVIVSQDKIFRFIEKHKPLKLFSSRTNISNKNEQDNKSQTQTISSHNNNDHVQPDPTIKVPEKNESDTEDELSDFEY